MSNIPSSFNNFRSSDRGSVWALYLLVVIILRARFVIWIICYFQSPSMLFQIASAKERWNHTSFLAIFDVCTLQLMYSFIVIPIKRWNSFDLYFTNYQIWYRVCWDNCLIIMENREIVFWTFRESLLTASQSEVSHNSSLSKWWLGWCRYHHE